MSAKETQSNQSDQADGEKLRHPSSSHSGHIDNHDAAKERRDLALANAGSISLDDVAPVSVQIRRLAVSVDTAPSWIDPSTYAQLFASRFNTKPRPKRLLYSASADLQPGTLTAIVGGSGSGKTTLLNAVAERVVSSRLTQQGQVTFNGQPGVSSVKTAYVMQQDILIPTLTVRETLQYSADLRLPPSVGEADRERIVEEVILELGLKECAGTRIGNAQHRGCSGGEKRRVSIGVQLLANPSVLFLDEPTTGLDATSAFQLIRTLKSLAQKGRTVITTIHQPRSEIWDFFDNLIVLSKGSPAYSGLVSDCIPWFDSQGYKLPPYVNPAEHIVDITAVDNRTPELEEETSSRVDALKAAWEAHSRKAFTPLNEAVTSFSRGKTRKDRADLNSPAGFFRQTQVLTRRTFKTTIRDPLGMAACILEACFIGLCMGYMFFNLGRDLSGIRSREGGLYIAAGLQPYVILLFEVYRLTMDIPVFDREVAEGCVSALPYIISRRLARLFVEDIPVPLLFSAIFYFMANFERDAGRFFIFFAISFLNQYIAVMCALTCVATVRQFAGATLIANLVFTLQSTACGIFIQVDTIPVYVRWLKWTAFTFYSFGSYTSNEFQGNFYDCPGGRGPEDPACRPYTGRFIMDSLGFPANWVWRPIVVLVAFVVFFFILSFIGLTFLKVEISISRARISDTDLSAGKEKMKARSISEVRAIDLRLDQFALHLDKRTARGNKLPRKTILEPVTATFQAGVLNVIMGPSGSGKTSLLNAMALRLRNSAGTRYLPSGQLTFNGAAPSDLVIRSVCSYVCQDDDALLPSLTVRETLRFAAGLRLPSFMSTEEKNHRAEDILMKMGLKDCADNLVGNELVKGISGGEKRRVSIAVQILTDPRILLLDEPTSGLDAFTANSIMEVLRGLADEGRTLILTIHQARSDLFKHFGNALLLARGGSPVYAGAAKEMLGYFEDQGYRCPQQTNPADFALDLITVDLQQEQREAESRTRVQNLIRIWNQTNDDEAVDASGDDHQQSENEDENSTRPRKELDNSSDIEDDGRATEREDCELKTKPSNASNNEFAKRPSLAASTSQKKILHKASLSTPAELGALVRKPASFATAFPLLLQRSMINFRRQPDLMVARIMQVVGLAIVLTLFFAPLRNDYFSVQTRMGWVQELGALYFVGMLQNVAVYPMERDVFYREDDDGVYSVQAFMAVYTVLEVPFEIISSLLFGCLYVLACGLPRTVEIFFVSVFFCFGVVSCGESLGIMFNTVFSHTGFAVNAMGALLSVATAMGGVLSIDMPALFNAFNYLSPVRYGIKAVTPYALLPVRFWCTDEQKLPNGRCPIETGQDVLDLYNFHDDPRVQIGALAACVVVYRILAFMLLKVVRRRWGDRKGKRFTRGFQV